MSVDGGVAVSVLQFLLNTLREYWGRTLEGSPQFQDLCNTLFTQLSRIEDDLSALRDADRNVAAVRFVRGLDVFTRNAADESVWRHDLASALDSAENGYHRVKTVQEKILCFEIMCSCFLLLRSPESALISIKNQMTVLFDEKHIRSSLSSLRRSVCESKPLAKEDKELLELFFSRVCGVIAAFEHLECYTEKYRASFRELFGKEPLKSATDPTVFNKWKDIQVYKYSTSMRVAGVTAHALLPVVPVLSGMTTVMTAGYVRPRNAGVTSLNTKPLVEYYEKGLKDRTNLYDFRWQLLDLAHCNSSRDYKLGSVFLTEHSDGWIVDSKRDFTVDSSKADNVEDTPKIEYADGWIVDSKSDFTVDSSKVDNAEDTPKIEHIEDSKLDCTAGTEMDCIVEPTCDDESIYQC